MVYNAQMIRFRPHIYIYKVYFIKGTFAPPPGPLRKGKGGEVPPFRRPWLKTREIHLQVANFAGRLQIVNTFELYSPFCDNSEITFCALLSVLMLCDVK